MTFPIILVFFKSQGGFGVGRVDDDDRKRVVEEGTYLAKQKKSEFVITRLGKYTKL